MFKMEDPRYLFDTMTSKRAAALARMVAWLWNWIAFVPPFMVMMMVLELEVSCASVDPSTVLAK
jgi:hypothetical protein